MGSSNYTCRFNFRWFSRHIHLYNEGTLTKIDAPILIFLIGVPLIFFSGTIQDAFGLKLLSTSDDNSMAGTATHIPDPFNNSYFTLEVFEREGQSHWYSFIGQKGQEILIQTNVPDIESSRDFVPSFDLLIGNDKVTAPTQSTMFFEEFTNTNWIKTAELRMVLPDDGIYFIRAHDELFNYHIGATGKFSLVVGEVDNLSLLDWIQVPFWILLVNQFFENFVFVTIMLTFLFIIAVIVFVMINRRGKN